MVQFMSLPCLWLRLHSLYNIKVNSISSFHLLDPFFLQNIPCQSKLILFPKRILLLGINRYVTLFYSWRSNIPRFFIEILIKKNERLATRVYVSLYDFYRQIMNVSSYTLHRCNMYNYFNFMKNFYFQTSKIKLCPRYL